MIFWEFSADLINQSDIGKFILSIMILPTTASIFRILNIHCDQYNIGLMLLFSILFCLCLFVSFGII